MTTTNPTTIEASGTHAITIVRDFEHPVEKVFRAMTDPELIGRWMGPKAMTTTEVSSDARHGGTWTFTHTGPEGDAHQFRGVFHGDQTPELSLRTFEWLGMPGHVSLESLRLEDLGDGRTRAHSSSAFMSPEDRDGMLHSGMDKGVTEGYERLDDVLEAL